VDHAHSGAILAYNILTKMGMHHREAAEIMLAIGNHDEGTGLPSV
jgi:plasmid maintenance system antidote protein VapI